MKIIIKIIQIYKLGFQRTSIFFSLGGGGGHTNKRNKTKTPNLSGKKELTVYCYQLQSLFYLRFPAERSLRHLQGCKSDKTLPVN